MDGVSVVVARIGVAFVAVAQRAFIHQVDDVALLHHLWMIGVGRVIQAITGGVGLAVGSGIGYVLCADGCSAIGRGREEYAAPTVVGRTAVFVT